MAQRGGGRLVAAVVAVFLVAVLMARLLIGRDELWRLFLLALPVLLVGLGLAFGFVRAVILVALFSATVLAFAW
ncbi:MAG: hypothetical protein LC620_03575, partial [Halobacteriales archaeon]|nr:hypothetical protein [Halobacteriales archaeon]